ncbi:MAG: nucleoside deaminase [Bacteroidetes bacterium]|nr:nucleoside deaminase [Bacteroidota bacterium]
MQSLPDKQTDKDQYFLRQAIELALNGMRSNEGGPFGAIVVKDDVIIGRGNNRVSSGLDPTAHAEVVAIRDACAHLNHFQLEGCTIYSSCEPCPMCLGAIYWARPDRLVFAAGKRDAADIAGFDDQFIYDELDLPIDKRKIPSLQLLREEGLLPFREWRDKDDKIVY